MYKPNPDLQGTALRTLQLLYDDTPTMEIAKTCGVSRGRIQQVLIRLERLGYIVPYEKRAPYVVTDNGKKYLESIN